MFFVLRSTHVPGTMFLNPLGEDTKEAPPPLSLCRCSLGAKNRPLISDFSLFFCHVFLLSPLRTLCLWLRLGVISATLRGGGVTMRETAKDFT